MLSILRPALAGAAFAILPATVQASTIYTFEFEIALVNVIVSAKEVDPDTIDVIGDIGEYTPVNPVGYYPSIMDYWPFGEFRADSITFEVDLDGTVISASCSFFCDDLMNGSGSGSGVFVASSNGYSYGASLDIVVGGGGSGSRSTDDLGYFSDDNYELVFWHGGDLFFEIRNVRNINAPDVEVIPLPASLPLLGAGMLAIGALAARRRRSS